MAFNGWQNSRFQVVRIGQSLEETSQEKLKTTTSSMVKPTVRNLWFMTAPLLGM
jgi:hypothetical protein